MNNQEALALVKTTFSLIMKAKNVSSLKDILSSHPSLTAKQMDRSKYPELQLQITPEDVSSLMGQILDDDLRLHADLSARLNTPLEKLLYALAWKNGDLQKIGHIVKGASEAGQPIQMLNGPAQVFKQFGRHLADRSEPIVDQHVLRAFELYEQIDNPDAVRVAKIRAKINWDKDVACIERYKNWLSEHFSERQREDQGYIVNVDMVLFALGRAVKITNKRGQVEEN